MGIQTCRICYSEHREEIEELLKKGVPMKQIAERYQKKFDTDDIHLIEQSVAGHRKHIKKKLTNEEKKLLDRFEKGEVSLDEMSRIVATRAFEKILKNPKDIRFIDFFRTELLRQKEEAMHGKSILVNDLISRAFHGELPPRYCPTCKLNLFSWVHNHKFIFKDTALDIQNNQSLDLPNISHGEEIEA